MNKIEKKRYLKIIRQIYKNVPKIVREIMYKEDIVGLISSELKFSDYVDGVDTSWVRKMCSDEAYWFDFYIIPTRRQELDFQLKR